MVFYKPVNTATSRRSPSLRTFVNRETTSLAHSVTANVRNDVVYTVYTGYLFNGIVFSRSLDNQRALHKQKPFRSFHNYSRSSLLSTGLTTSKNKDEGSVPNDILTFPSNAVKFQVIAYSFFQPQVLFQSYSVIQVVVR